MTDLSKRGRSNRRKGQANERRVAALYRAIYGDKVKRGRQSRQGDDAADVEGTDLWLECKAGATVSVLAALDQAERDSDGRIPVVHVRIHNRRRYVALREDDWMGIVRRLAILDAVEEAGQ